MLQMLLPSAPVLSPVCQRRPPSHVSTQMYELAADQALGVKGSFFSDTKMSLHKTGAMSRAAVAAQGMAAEQAALQKLEQGSEEQKAAAEKSAATMKEKLFTMLALDIESTIGRAVSLCLADTSVDKETRRERAKGIMKLGKIFQGKLTPPVDPAAAEDLPGISTA